MRNTDLCSPLLAFASACLEKVRPTYWPRGESGRGQDLNVPKPHILLSLMLMASLRCAKGVTLGWRVRGDPDLLTLLNPSPPALWRVVGEIFCFESAEKVEMNWYASHILMPLPLTHQF